MDNAPIHILSDHEIMTEQSSFDREERFDGRYRIASTRLHAWNYGGPGWYFVTVCTHGRIPWFGSVENGSMKLSDIGKTVDHYWKSISMHHSHVRLDAHIVMPDHVHGIVVIERGKPTPHAISELHDAHATVETRDLASLPKGSNTFGPLKPKSLQSIIHGFKGSATRWCRENGHPDFRWQPRFFDKILWNEEDIDRTRRYIEHNPHRWTEKHTS